MRINAISIIKSIARRTAYGVSVTTLLLNLFACATEPTYSYLPSTTEVPIGVEEVVQVPIEEKSARERAAENIQPCKDLFGDGRNSWKVGFQCTRGGLNF